MRCKATTKQGAQCRNSAQRGSPFCWKHQDKLDLKGLFATAFGGLLGNMVAPGLGGIVAGGVVANVANRYVRENTMAKKKVFVSFDFDNDKALKDFIIGQSKLSDSPFEVVDHSLKEAAPEASWESKANAAIKRAEVVIVMVGPNTYRARGVLKEVKMARDANKYIVQIIGYRDGDYTPVAGAGRLYRWNWDNLKKILS